MAKYGSELVKSLEAEIAQLNKTIKDRADRVDQNLTDIDDCFISQRVEERAISLCNDKINLIKEGGCSWFAEYATLNGTIVDAVWLNCKTAYGYKYKLKVVLPDGSIKWTQANTPKGLAKVGLKRVLCKRPAWFKFTSSNSGLMGVYTGSYVLFPSSFNYATGETAKAEPIEVKDYEEVS